MEPVAAGFLILIGAAGVLGVLTGAIGGALAWRLRLHLLLGALLTALAFVLFLFIDHGGRLAWIRAELAFGLPPMVFAFLTASIASRWLALRSSLRPTWTAVAAFGIAMVTGALCLLLFRIGPAALLTGAISADVLLLLVLLLMTRRLRRT